MYRRTVAAAVLAAAMAAGPASSALAQGDTERPTLNVATLAPLGPAQYGTGTGGVNPVFGTGVGIWFVKTGATFDGVTLNLSAADNVAVERLQYSLDNGANWIDVPITPGPSVTGAPKITQEGNTNVRYRAIDAAGNVSLGAPAATTLNQPAAAGADRIRLQSTTGRAAGDVLVIDTGDNQETAMIASIITPAPGTNPNVALTAPLTRAHAAGVTVSATPPFRAIAVPIDTRRPETTFPTVVNNRVAHSQMVTPTRTDPTPGSGGTAIRAAELDGAFTYPQTLDASKLSLGRHTWALTAGDAAGNGSKTTLTFLVTTSYGDVDTFLTRFTTAGTISAATAAALRDKLTAARTADEAGNEPDAITILESFVEQARSDVATAAARNLLIEDAQDLIRQARGITLPDPPDLGVQVVDARGANQHPLATPLPSGSNPGAGYRVLVIANRSDGFRHEHIPTTARMIQQLGEDYGFDVDVYDFVYPALSVPNPFTTTENLKKYKVIVGNSSVGLNTFVTGRTCTAAAPCEGLPEGSIVNEQAAFQGYIEGGGGFVSIHGASDSMQNWPFYVDMIGGSFRNHGNASAGMQPQCGSCNIAEVITEDGTHPSTQHFDKRWAVMDELYNFTSPPREKVHPLLLLNDSSFSSQIGATVGTQTANAIPGFGPDHPISWCLNYKQGRVFAQVMMHNWELNYDPKFQRNILKGIEWAAGLIPGNCVTHREVTRFLDAEEAAGSVTPGAAAAGRNLVSSAYTRYLEKNYSAAVVDINALRELAQDAGTGQAGARSQLLSKAQQLKDWMLVLGGADVEEGQVSGTVPATLSLSVGPAASLGSFVPGVSRDYTASLGATVTSTGGDAALTVTDPSSVAPGRLVNGAFALPQALQASATSAKGTGGAFGPIGGAASPLALLSYSEPVSNDAVTINLKQSIAASDGLRTGTYGKTLTFTLSTTAP
jgi:type 1 glutamine amidotransferase